MARRIPLLIVTLLALAVAAPALASYGWPIKPFRKQHPIRANFGDPRTVFELPLYEDGINGPGAFSFHNGVDIAAPNGTTVYAVASGIAHLIDATAVSVETLDGRTFQYYHVIPTVVDGEKVTTRISEIGDVQAPYAHVHLTEIDGTKATNPLLKGHLTPYTDRTRPAVTEVEIRDAAGRLAEPLGICGRISLAAEASDRPSLPVSGTFGGLPVAPALVTWRLQRVGGPVVVPATTAVDFRTTLPPPKDFWSFYARGSYQNAPRFGVQQFGSMPGRFLFQLTSSLDTRTLPNGPYVLTVVAADERGNAGDLTQRFWVFNQRTPTGCPLLPGPPAPAPAPAPPTTTTEPPPAVQTP
jgi:hypothetical protein